MATELEVRLTANIRDLQSQLKKAEKTVSNYGIKVDQQGAKAGAGLAKTGKGAANALPAMQEFSRVIQDAPFGIMGVGNNIQQLTANFGNLTRNAGGAGAALKLMLGSLAGPAGILLAVSAVTSLMTVFRDKLKFATSATKELAKATKEFTTEALTEVNTLKGLISIAENLNNSYKVRTGALEEINKKYGDYLGNLSLEELQSKETKTAVDNLTKSILQQAKVKGVEALITEKISDKSEDLSESLVKQRAAYAQVRTELVRLNSTYGLGIDLTQGLGTAANEAFAAINKIGGRKSGIGGTLDFVVNQYAEASKDLKGVSKDIENEIEPLNELLTSLKVGQLSFDTDSIDNGVTVIGEKIKSSVAKFKNEFINLEDVFGVTTATQNSLDKFKPNFDNFAVEFNKLGDIVGFAIKNSVDKAIPQLSRMENALKQFNGTAKDIIDNGLTDTFAGIGRAIGASLTEGGNFMNNLGKELLGALGNMITQLGELAIQTGVKMLAIKLGFASLNPALLIGAGVALVALGSVFSKGATSIGAGAGGGVAGQGSRDGGSISNNTASFGASGSGGGTVVFEIQGQKLVGVLNRTLGANARLGGNVNLGG